MYAGIAVFLVEFCYAGTMIFLWECPVGADNQLVCFIHYIKFFQTIWVMRTYYTNIQENQPNHPISTINTFLVILLYYVCLYAFLDVIKDNPNMVHFCVFYVIADFCLILGSFVAIHQVKVEAHALINERTFKEYS